MLGIVIATTRATAYAQTRVLLKPLATIRIQQLHRGHPFPGIAFAICVNVNAICDSKQVVEVGYQRDGGDAQQRIVNAIGVVGVMRDIGIHAVLHLLPVDIKRRPLRAWRGVARRALLHHVLDEKVRVRVNVGRVQTRLVGPRTYAGGLADQDRSGIQGTARVGRTAVGGKINLRAWGCTDDRERERVSVESAIMTKLGVGHKIACPAGIDRTRG